MSRFFKTESWKRFQGDRKITSKNTTLDNSVTNLPIFIANKGIFLITLFILYWNIAD